MRRSEQQQQKRISMLKPADETILEHTIGYEQLAVDLTAGLAQMVGDSYVKKALDFALLEDLTTSTDTRTFIGYGGGCASGKSRGPLYGNYARDAPPLRITATPMTPSKSPSAKMQIP